MMKEIIKTDNPDIVIERVVIDKEYNIKSLEDEVKHLSNQLNDLRYIEVKEEYDDAVKNIIKDKNYEIELERVYIESQIIDLQNKLNELNE